MLLHTLEYIFGPILIAAVLLDVFLTVLYARVSAGIISPRLARAMWKIFRALARLFPRHCDSILSFCGPSILVVLVCVWVLGLMFGGGMIIQPSLGSGVTATSGPTYHTFSVALYIAGDALTTVGSTDYAPRTAPMRLLYTFMSLVGISMLTLTLTYFLEIYNALQSRNTFAVKLHAATADTGDAAELIAGIGPRGEFNAGYTHLVEMAAEMVHLFEAHHFYAVLLYFRFREPQYALSRMALVTLDTVSLLKSALDDDGPGWVKESAAVLQLWRGSMHTLTELAIAFLPGGLPDAPEPDAQTIERWRQRYQAGVARLREAGIQTLADEINGAETYVALRAKWNRYLFAFADYMVHPMDQIDPVGADPAGAADRPDFSRRLRAAG
jgi:hypothetical protein